MILKKRVVVYSITHKKLDYFDAYKTTTRVFVKVLDSFGNIITYWSMPIWCRFPAHFECYCKGLEDSWKSLKLDRYIERADYEY